MVFETFLKSNMPLSNGYSYWTQENVREGEYNWVREYSPAVTPEPKQNKGAITMWWSGTHSSYSEKLKQTDLFFLACPMQAGNVNSLLNSLNNGIKSLLRLGCMSTLLESTHSGKDCTDGQETWVMVAPQGSASFVCVSIPPQACRTPWLRMFIGFASKEQGKTLPPECHS